ncbi:hypothetical protein [Bradyrhizobium sp. ORS 86]|uniref:hypothetical protein n=1 Tax=Bradyrhizobium sp. ORS 86 TaxID=1685970 RepID=UPI003890B20F
MKLYTGWIAAAGLALSAASAQAQLLTPARFGSPSLVRVSDLDGPYAAVPPPDIPPPPRYGRVPTLLPPMEVYTVLRENGYLPLGAPRQRGFVYTISVIDRDGADGRLVIDARNGRIVSFTPADRVDDDYDNEPTAAYGPIGPMLRPIQARVPRPPLPIPHVARRAVPKRSPLAAKPAPAPAPAQAAVAPSAPPQAAAPAPAPQAVAAAPKPAEARAAAPEAAPAQAAAPTIGQSAPPAAAAAPAILPTQEMPKVQGFE